MLKQHLCIKGKHCLSQLHREYCAQFWAPQSKKEVNKLEQKYNEETWLRKMRKLSLFSLSRAGFGWLESNFPIPPEELLWQSKALYWGTQNHRYKDHKLKWEILVFIIKWLLSGQSNFGTGCIKVLWLSRPIGQNPVYPGLNCTLTLLWTEAGLGGLLKSHPASRIPWFYISQKEKGKTFVSFCLGLR